MQHSTELDVKAGDEVRALFKQLDSPWVWERHAAERALFRRGPQSVDALLAYLEELKRRRHLLPFLVLGRGMLIVLLLLAAFCAVGALFQIPIPVWVGWGLFSGFVGGVSSNFKRSWNTTLQVLACCDDVRVIGPLVEFLPYTKDSATRAAMSKRLIQLLPRLQAGDHDQLNKRQRECLYRELAGDHEKLIHAILKAFKQVGDRDAMPHIRQLLLILNPDERNHKMAEECLEILLQRAEQERVRQTLLRASDATEATPESLLRPATDREETDTQQLLRPHTTSNQE